VTSRQPTRPTRPASITHRHRQQRLVLAISVPAAVARRRRSRCRRRRTDTRHFDWGGSGSTAPRRLLPALGGGLPARRGVAGSRQLGRGGTQRSARARRLLPEQLSPGSTPPGNAPPARPPARLADDSFLLQMTTARRPTAPTKHRQVTDTNSGHVLGQRNFCHRGWLRHTDCHDYQGCPAVNADDEPQPQHHQQRDRQRHLQQRYADHPRLTPGVRPLARQQRRATARPGAGQRHFWRHWQRHRGCATA